MDLKKTLFAVLALVSLGNAVKVNMQGSLSLGKSVMDTFSHYMRKNHVGESRRSMPIPNQESVDVLFLIIQSTYLCRDLHFCDTELENFLNEYILVHTKSIEIILMELIPNAIKDEKSETEFIFKEQLRTSLQEIRKMLRTVSLKPKDNDYASSWIEIMKRISVMFQNEAIEFASERIDGTPAVLSELNKIVTQKFVISSVIIEGRYENKICSEYNICTNNYKCSKALHTLLGSFKEMDDENVKIFMRLVSETILQTKFYDQLSETTASEFQILLNDMAYYDNVPTRDVLLKIHKAVEDRLNSIGAKAHNIRGRDVELVHRILSDLDHVYSKQDVADPFYEFLRSFFEWTRTGSRLGPQMRTLVDDLTDRIFQISDDLILKLSTETRVFLELTVDPEK